VPAFRTIIFSRAVNHFKESGMTDDGPNLG